MSNHAMFDAYASYDYDRSDYDDLRAQVRFERRLRNKLMRHPNPRDPDYPFDDDDDCGTEDEGDDHNG